MQPQWINAQQLWQRLAGLFPDAQLQSQGLHTRLWADPVLLQQVMINLIKNAQEAGSPSGSILVTFVQEPSQCVIRVVDHGHGIANIDNIFVPFYSTKPQGQGIGLSLSRHIIEQMGGSLVLDNNPAGQGGAVAEVRLSLPV